MKKLSVNSNKAALARLLATEDILVRHRSDAETAYFDLTSRVLTLPEWKDLSNELYDMLLIHEVGHALDTPQKDWLQSIGRVAHTCFPKNPQGYHNLCRDYLNVVEDARIDKLQKRRYPGCRYDYREGQLELMSRGFFGKLSQIKQAKFIDRLNTYFKLEISTPGVIHVPFSDEELKFVKRIEKLETYAQVEEIVVEIINWEKIRTRKVSQKVITVGRTPSGEADPNLPPSKIVKTGPVDVKKLVESLKEKNETPEAEDTEQEEPEVEETSDDENGAEDDRQLVDSSDAENNVDRPEEQALRDSYEEVEPEEEEEPEEKPEDEDDLVEELNSVLSDLQDEMLKKMIDKDLKEEKSKNYYVQAPVLARGTDLYVLKSPDFMAQFETNLKILNKTYESVTVGFNRFRSNTEKPVGAMAKEFNMRQAADVQRRTNASRTGILNMDKLVHYKTRDDLFLRQDKTSDGVSHGVVVVMDWSSSMDKIAKASLQQAIVLARFCRKVGIPFELYLFSDAFRGVGCYSVYDGAHYANKRVEEVEKKLYPFSTTEPDQLDGRCSMDSCVLIQLISSELSEAQFNQALAYTYALANHKSVRSMGFGMGGTPLDASILQMEGPLRAFKDKYGTQFTHLIYLTDGDGGQTLGPIVKGQYAYVKEGDKVIILDPISKQKYSYFENGQYTISTKIVLDILKSRIPGLTTSNFFLGTESSTLRKEATKEERSFVLKNRYLDAGRPMGGFDNYYCIDPKVFSNFVSPKGLSITGSDMDSIASSFMSSAEDNKRGMFIVRALAKRLAG